MILQPRLELMQSLPETSADMITQSDELSPTRKALTKINAVRHEESKNGASNDKETSSLI